MSAVAAKQMSDESCVLIPLNGTQLLLPNICVAEILPWRRVKPLKEQPAWCLGLLGWRGEAVPVVRFELLNEAGGQDRKMGRCMIVMNRARSADGLPFYALAAEGLPRMVQLSGDDVSVCGEPLGRAEVASVKVGAEPAVIPNLEFLERQVAKVTR